MAQFRSASSNGTGSTSLSITTPSGAAPGDVLIAYLLTDEIGNTITPVQEGWDAGPSYNTTDISFATFTRTLSGSPEASYSFTSTSQAIGGIIAIDAEGGTPTIASAISNSAGTATATSSAITNVSDSRVFVTIWACDSNYTVTTPPSGGTTAHSLLAPSSPSVSLAAYYEETPGDVGNIVRTLTWSGPETLATAAFLVSFTGGGAGNEDVEMNVNPAGLLELTGSDIPFRMVVEGAAGVLQFTGSDIDLIATVSNDWTVEVEGSTLTFSGSDVLFGTLMTGIVPGQLRFTGSNITLEATGAIVTPPWINSGLFGSWIFKIARVYVVSATGRTKWTHYIPVKKVTVTDTEMNTFSGAVAVEVLSSTAGLTEWVDYIPVVEVNDDDAGKWRTDNNGFIPIVEIL